MVRYRIRHYVGGYFLDTAKLAPAPEVRATDLQKAAAEFDQYCGQHLRPGDSANLVDSKNFVVRSLTRVA